MKIVTAEAINDVLVCEPAIVNDTQQRPGGEKAEITVTFTDTKGEISCLNV